VRYLVEAAGSDVAHDGLSAQMARTTRCDVVELGNACVPTPFWKHDEALTSELLVI
jgi:hypothetical protein